MFWQLVTGYRAPMYTPSTIAMECPPTRLRCCLWRGLDPAWSLGQWWDPLLTDSKQALAMSLDYVLLQVLYSTFKNLELKLIIISENIESSVTILIALNIHTLFIFSGRRANTILYGILYGGACITKVGEKKWKTLTFVKFPDFWSSEISDGS